MKLVSSVGELSTRRCKLWYLFRRQPEELFRVGTLDVFGDLHLGVLRTALFSQRQCHKYLWFCNASAHLNVLSGYQAFVDAAHLLSRMDGRNSALTLTDQKEQPKPRCQW